MAEISKVVTVNSYNGIIEEANRRKHNLLLESVLIDKESKRIGDTANQGF